MAKSRTYIWVNGQKVHVGPEYPKLGAAVEKWRRVARNSALTKEDRRKYGAAVDEAMRGLHRAELESCCRQGKLIMGEVYRISLTSIARLTKYSRPNPFRMIGDPPGRDEKALYAAAMAEKRART